MDKMQNSLGVDVNDSYARHWVGTEHAFIVIEGACTPIDNTSPNVYRSFDGALRRVYELIEWDRAYLELEGQDEWWDYGDTWHHQHVQKYHNGYPYIARVALKD